MHAGRRALQNESRAGRRRHNAAVRRPRGQHLGDAGHAGTRPRNLGTQAAGREAGRRAWGQQPVGCPLVFCRGLGGTSKLRCTRWARGWVALTWQWYGGGAPWAKVACLSCVRHPRCRLACGGQGPPAHGKGGRRAGAGRRTGHWGRRPGAVAGRPWWQACGGEGGTCGLRGKHVRLVAGGTASGRRLTRVRAPAGWSEGAGATCARRRWPGRAAGRLAAPRLVRGGGHDAWLRTAMPRGRWPRGLGAECRGAGAWGCRQMGATQDAPVARHQAKAAPAWAAGVGRVGASAPTLGGQLAGPLRRERARALTR